MKKLKLFVLSLGVLSSTSSIVLADGGDAAGAACSAAACGVGAIVYILIIAVSLAIPIAIIIFEWDCSGRR